MSEVPEQVQQVHLIADKVVVGDGELTVLPSPVQGIVDGECLEEVALEQHQQGSCSWLSVRPPLTMYCLQLSCESEHNACSPYVNQKMRLPMEFYQP